MSDGMIVTDWQVEAGLLLISKLSPKSTRLFQIPRLGSKVRPTTQCGNAQTLTVYLQPSEQDKIATAHLLYAGVDKALQESTPAELEALERPQVPPASSCVTSENIAKFIFSGNFAGAVHIHVRLRRIMLAKSWNYAFMDSRNTLAKSSYYALARGDTY